MAAPLPKIDTEHLSLVPLRIEDEAAMLGFERHLEREKAADLRRSDEFYQRRLMTWVRNANSAIPTGMWKIIIDERLVGRAGIDWSERSGCPELSYALIPEARHRGHATVAVKALIRWAFDNSDKPAILAVARPTNRASIAVMQRSGMIPHSDTDENNVVFVAMRLERCQRLLGSI